MRGFCLVVRELKFIVGRLLVIDVTCIASFKVSKLLHEHVMALRRDMENGSANPHFLGVEGVLLAEPDLIEWFTGCPEGLKDLVIVNNMIKQERHH